jgi:hypothetical protein
MAKSRSSAGGGIRSKQHVSVGVRTGKPRQGHNVKAVSQVGQNLGDHITERRGIVNPIERDQERRPVSAGVPLGNEVARNVGRGGPGTGRNVMACGSQGQHGSAVPGNAPAKNTDILRQFGPDVPGRR